MNYYPDITLTRDEVLHAAGVGNWRRFEQAGLSLPLVADAASGWKAALGAAERPWLCWNVDPDWCHEQQRQVLAAGWTPVVGFDPRVGPPPVLNGAVLIDFNAQLGLPVMWPHFPLEFVHWWAPRLAFWHSDLLLRPEKMRSLAETFDRLPDGWMMAVRPRFSWREALAGRLRYWELVGCTTAGASDAAFHEGCGWWMGWPYHVMTADRERERERRKRYYWDHGAGIRYWRNHRHGKVRLIPESYVAEGHFTRIGKPDYQRASPDNFQRDLSKDLPLNFSLGEAKRKLGIA
jgi:hypothetical protein